MNAWKRSILSIRRKPKRTALLALIVFVIASCLLAGIASKHANVAVQDESKQAVGAAYRLEINEADRRKRLETLEPVQYPNGAWGTPIPNNEFESLLLPDIEKIASVEGVSSYNITTRTTCVRPVGFQRIEDPEKDQYADFGGVNLYGNRDMQLDFNVRDENIRIIQGSPISPNDKDAAVISSQLAEMNGFTIGDTISFEPLQNKGEVCTATIIGIFAIDHPIPSTMDGDTFRSENTIFTDLRFPEKAEGHRDDPCFKYATFQVEKVDAYHAVKESIYQLDINWLRYDLIDNNGISKQMAENFNNLSRVSDLFIGIVSISSLLILLLVFVFWTKSRKHEIGVLLALGNRRRTVLFQFLGEALLVGCLAFVLAGLASPIISGGVAHYLATQQHEQATETLQLNEELVTHSGTVAVGQDSISGVEVSINPEVVLAAGTITMILIACAVLLSGIMILRRKPMHLLNEMS